MIAIDWGSTSLRAFRLDARGNVLETRRSEDGVLAAAGRFADVLEGAIDGWDDRLILASGMIGSRQGWQEVSYVDCPAGLDEIAEALVRLRSPVDAREVWLVPGLVTRPAGGAHDVMRGEETQVCGLLDALASGSHWVCLPGTHSKMVQIEHGRIERFRTAMTGEVFDLLCRHSLLGRLMEPGPHVPSAFAQGLDEAAGSDGLLSQLFAVRTRGLFGELAPSALASYLSGLLIGHELNELPSGIDTLHLVGADRLLALYRDALARRGIASTGHPDLAAARGLHALALRRGLRVDAP